MDKSVLDKFYDLSYIEKTNKNISYYIKQLEMLYNKKNELNINLMHCNDFNKINNMINNLINHIDKIDITEIQDVNHDTTNIQTSIDNINKKYNIIKKTFIPKK